MSYSKKSDWVNTTLNPNLASELQRMDDGIEAATNITNVSSADKVNHDLVFQLNEGSSEGTNQFTFNGSRNAKINLTPSRLYGISDGSVWTVIQNSSGSPRSLLILEYVVPDTNYRRVNQSFVLTARSETIILDVVLTTTTSSKFSDVRVSYIPLTKNGESIANNLSVEVSEVDSDHHQFKLWYYQSSTGVSLSIRPISRNAENHLLTGYSYNSTASGGVVGKSVMDVTIRNAFPDTLDPTANSISSGTDIDTMLHPGMYYAARSNKCTNIPDNVDAFGLIVERISGGYYYQELISANTSKTAGTIFYRMYNGNTWSQWNVYYSSVNDKRIISGLWQPSTTDTSADFEFSQGIYIKVDRHVHCEWQMVIKSTSAGSVIGGTINFQGLPYPVFGPSDGSLSFGGSGLVICSNSEFVSGDYSGSYSNLWTVTPVAKSSTYNFADIAGTPLSGSLISSLRSVIADGDIKFRCTLDYITS